MSWEVAERIVMFREQHGPFETFGELTKIEDFPSDKIKRISLYLSL
ncbi:MAG: helix-hairpin-helix domain-containing protein [Eudoraea sp.]|nr:helix-hairpin-helix domain-containing protein [Eudoraea sp.]